MELERIRYATSADGTKIAWTECGAGPRTLVVVANMVTDIRNDWASPLRSGMLKRPATHFRLVRYDHRGCGSSERNVLRQGLAAWTEDLEAVIRAAAGGERCVLFGTSQAGSIATAFAAANPQWLSHLILYAPVIRGSRAGDDPRCRALSEALLEMIRHGWGDRFPGPRMLVTGLLVPDATDEESRWHREHMLRAIDPDDAYRFFEADSLADATPMLGRIATPTLVVQPSDDAVVLPEWSRATAAAIPGAQYTEIQSRSHIPIERDSGLRDLVDAVLAFTETGGQARRTDCLSARERQILDCVCLGMGNEAIAAELRISAKTVRNHLTNVFDKLGVDSRTQAMAVRFRSQGPVAGAFEANREHAAGA